MSEKEEAIEQNNLFPNLSPSTEFPIPFDFPEDMISSDSSSSRFKKQIQEEQFKAQSDYQSQNSCPTTDLNKENSKEELDIKTQCERFSRQKISSEQTHKKLRIDNKSKEARFREEKEKKKEQEKEKEKYQEKRKPPKEKEQRVQKNDSLDHSLPSVSVQNIQNNTQSVHADLQNVQPSLEPSEQDTKNIFRNFGKFQNKYILNNPKARAHILQNLSQIDNFFEWVRKLRLTGLPQFKNVWGGQVATPLFTRVYKELCQKFYQEEAASYVRQSKMDNEARIMTYLKYIPKFLEGIRNTQNFKELKKRGRKINLI